MDKYKDLVEHKKKFNEIIVRYKLNEGKKAEEIAKFLTNPSKAQSTTPKEFATLFAMSEKEAFTFLSFIELGIRFREETQKK